MNDKARAAGSGNFGEVRNLAEAIFDFHQVRALAEAVPDVRERLIRAEIGYRGGSHPGISDRQVAKVVNAWARRLQAPDFSFTTTSEVRRLRASQISLFPDLVLRSGAAGSPAESVESEMSPIEGFHVLATLVLQKLNNPEYQRTYDEQVERWMEMRAQRGKPQAPEPPGERARLLNSLLDQEIARLPGRDRHRLAHATLTVLGIR